MEYVQSIVQSFGTGTTVIAIIGFLVWYIKHTEQRLAHGDTKFEMLEKYIMTIGRTALRLEIVNDKIPLLERAKAYEVYTKDFNGNGAIKHYYETEIEPYLTNVFEEHH